MHETDNTVQQFNITLFVYNSTIKSHELLLEWSSDLDWCVLKAVHYILYEMFIFVELSYGHTAWSIKKEDKVHCLFGAFWEEICRFKKLFVWTKTWRTRCEQWRHFQSFIISYLGKQEWKRRYSEDYVPCCNTHCSDRCFHYIHGRHLGCKPKSKHKR